jgi:hypothetical protein
MFASPLNFNMNMFCSIFLDTDKIFGSVGSFYNLSIDRLLNQNIKGVFFNPPYLPILMNYTTKICINLLEKMENENTDFTVISFLPNWADADYIQLFLQSKYLITFLFDNFFRIYISSSIHFISSFEFNGLYALIAFLKH